MQQQRKRGAVAMLGVDQGTTNSKAVLVDPSGAVVASGTHPVAIAQPKPGWFEQSPQDIWTSVLGAISRCLAAAPRVRLAGLAISNQRESVVAWSAETGEALTPVLGWQDARQTAYCEDLAATGVAPEVHRTTGLRLDPMFSAPKMRWALEHLLAAGHPVADIRFGTIDAFLIHRLTRGEVHVTEVGNASRTLLLDLNTRRWSGPMMDLFEIPPTALPEVKASNSDFGRVSDPAAVAAGLPKGLPISAILADSHAALYSYTSHSGTPQDSQPPEPRPSPGRLAKVTYGTGSSVMAPVAAEVPWSRAVATTLAWSVPDPLYALEANIIATGAALDQIAELVGCQGGQELSGLAAKAEDTGGLSVVPAFSGLGAPYWDRSALGVIVGLRRETSPAQLARAAFDAVAQQVCDAVEAVDAAGAPVKEIRADGGPSRNPALMQWQADLLGKPVAVGSEAEVSALGAARLAWTTLGVELPPVAPNVTYFPALDPDRRQSERDRWADAVCRSRGLAAKRRIRPETTEATP